VNSFLNSVLELVPDLRPSDFDSAYDFLLENLKIRQIEIKNKARNKEQKK
jgi:hypothetical protein